MTSSDTSRTGSGPAQAARLPPRGQLPPGIVIERLPIVGTSWYERGLSYWARRAAMVLVMVIVAAIYIAIITGVASAAGPPGSAGYVAVIIAEAVLSLGTGIWMVRRTLHQAASGQLVLPGRGHTSRAGRTGAGLGILAYSAGGAAGAVLLVVSALLSAGFVLAVLMLALTPVPPTERQARAQLAEQLRLHHQH
jgi:hypothetical protein